MYDYRTGKRVFGPYAGLASFKTAIKMYGLKTATPKKKKKDEESHGGYDETYKEILETIGRIKQKEKGAK